MAHRNKSHQSWKRRVFVTQAEGVSSVDINGVVDKVMRDIGCSDRSKIQVKVYKAPGGPVPVPGPGFSSNTSQQSSVLSSPASTVTVQSQHQPSASSSSTNRQQQDATAKHSPDTSQTHDEAHVSAANLASDSYTSSNSHSEIRHDDHSETSSAQTMHSSNSKKSSAQQQQQQQQRGYKRQVLSVPISCLDDSQSHSRDATLCSSSSSARVASSPPKTGFSPAARVTTAPSPIDMSDAYKAKVKDVLPLITSPLQMWPPTTCIKLATDPLYDPFVPFAYTPSQQLTNTVSVDKDTLRFLLLDCNDCRNLMFTCWCHEQVGGLPQNQKFEVVVCDRNAAVLARDIVLWKMLYDHLHGDQVKNSTNDPPDDNLFLKRAWLIFYEKIIDQDSLELLQTTAASLLSITTTVGSKIDEESYTEWNASSFGSIIKFVNQESFRRVQKVWRFYHRGIERGSVQENALLDHCTKGVAWIENSFHDAKNSGVVSSKCPHTDADVEDDQGILKAYKHHMVLYCRGVQEACKLLESSNGMRYRGSCVSEAPVSNTNNKLDRRLVANPMMFEGSNQHACCLPYTLDPINCFHTTNLPSFVPFNRNFCQSIPGFVSFNFTHHGQMDEETSHRFEELLSVNAFCEFNGWCRSFATRLRQHRLLVSVFVGNEIDLCHGLVIRRNSLGSHSQFYADLEDSSFDFGGMKLCTSTGLLAIDPTVIAPTDIAFDVIDTGRLSDVCGLLHVLLNCQPLLESHCCKDHGIGCPIESVLVTEFDSTYVLLDSNEKEMGCKVSLKQPSHVKHSPKKKQRDSKYALDVKDSNSIEEFSLPLPQYIYSMLGTDLTAFSLATGLVPVDPSVLSNKTTSCCTGKDIHFNRPLLHNPSIRVRWHSFDATLRLENRFVIDKDDLSEIAVDIYEMMFRNILDPSTCPIMMYYQPCEDIENVDQGNTRIDQSRKGASSTSPAQSATSKKASKGNRYQSKRNILGSVGSIDGSAKQVSSCLSAEEIDTDIMVKQIPVGNIRKNHSCLGFVMMMRNLFDRILFTADDQCTAAMRVVKALQDLELPLQYTMLFELLLGFSQLGMLPLVGLRIMSIAEASLMEDTDKDIVRPFLSSPEKPMMDIPSEAEEVPSSVTAPSHDTSNKYSKSEPSPSSVAQRRFSIDTTSNSTNVSGFDAASKSTSSRGQENIPSKQSNRYSAYPTAILLTLLVPKADVDAKLGPLLKQQEQGELNEGRSDVMSSFVLQFAIKSCAEKADNCYENFHIRYLRDKPEGYWNFETLSASTTPMRSFEDCRWLACSCMIPLPSLITRPANEIDIMLKVSVGNMFAAEVSSATRRLLLKTCGVDLIIYSAKLSDRSVVHWRRLDDVHVKSKWRGKYCGLPNSLHHDVNEDDDDAFGGDADAYRLSQHHEEKLGKQLYHACKSPESALAFAKYAAAAVSKSSANGEKQSMINDKPVERSSNVSEGGELSTKGQVELLLNGERFAVRDSMRLTIAEKKSISSTSKQTNRNSQGVSPALQVGQVDLTVRIAFKDDIVKDSLLTKPVISQLSRPHEVLLTMIFSLTGLAKTLTSLKRAAASAASSSGKSTIQAVCCNLILTLPIPVAANRTKIAMLTTSSNGGPGLQLIFSPLTYDFGLSLRHVTSPFALTPDRLSYVFNYDVTTGNKKCKADDVEIKPVCLFGEPSRVFLDLLPSIDITSATCRKPSNATSSAWLSVLLRSATGEEVGGKLSSGIKSSSGSRTDYSTVLSAWQESVRYLVHHLFVDDIVGSRDDLRIAVIRSKSKEQSDGMAVSGSDDAHINSYEIVVALNRLCLDFTNGCVNNPELLSSDNKGVFSMPWTEHAILDVCVAIMDAENDPISAALLLDFIDRHKVPDTPSKQYSSAGTGKKAGIVAATMTVTPDLMSFWIKILPALVERTRVSWQHDSQTCDLWNREIKFDNTTASQEQQQAEKQKKKREAASGDFVDSDDDTTRMVCCTCSKGEQVDDTSLGRFVESLASAANSKSSSVRERHTTHADGRFGFAQFIFQEMPELVSAQFSRAAIPVCMPIPVIVNEEGNPVV